MKLSEIQEGNFYQITKSRLAEVISIKALAGGKKWVDYRILPMSLPVVRGGEGERLEGSLYSFAGKAISSVSEDECRVFIEAKIKAESDIRAAEEISEQAEREKEALLKCKIAESSERSLKLRSLGNEFHSASTRLLLLSLLWALGERAEKTFQVEDCRAISPHNVFPFIDALISNGVVREHADQADDGVYFLKDGKLRFYVDGVVLSLIPEKGEAEFRPDTGALESSFSNGDTTGLHDLWIDYATAECMAYFKEQCAFVSLFPDQSSWSDIDAALRLALQTYSISNIWAVIWKVVKDAAALSQREYYNSKRAAATVQGKFRRHLDGIRTGANKLFSWDRPGTQPAGTIGYAFDKLFGLNEFTQGEHVSRLISGRYAQQVAPAEIDEAGFFMDSSRRLLNELFSWAVKNDNSVELLVAINRLSKHGLALIEVVQELHSIIHPIGEEMMLTDSTEKAWQRVSDYLCSMG